MRVIEFNKMLKDRKLRKRQSGPSGCGLLGSILLPVDRNGWAFLLLGIGDIKVNSQKTVACLPGKCYDNRDHIFVKIVHTYSTVYRDNAQRSVMGSCQFEEFRQRGSFLFYRACRLFAAYQGIGIRKDR